MINEPFGLELSLRNIKNGNYTDADVQLVAKRCIEARSKNAKWCEDLAKAKEEIRELIGDSLEDHEACVNNCIRCGVISLRQEELFHSIGADISYSVTLMAEMMADEIIKLQEKVQELEESLHRSLEK